MRWLYFLTGDTKMQFDMTWLAQSINAFQYVEPPPAVAPAEGGKVSGVRERDRLVEGLFQENYELKLCMGALLHLLVSKTVLTPQEIKEWVERLAHGQHPFGYLGEETTEAPPAENNPWENLR